jgi:hypothetical protein
MSHPSSPDLNRAPVGGFPRDHEDAAAMREKIAACTGDHPRPLGVAPEDAAPGIDPHRERRVAKAAYDAGVIGLDEYLRRIDATLGDVIDVRRDHPPVEFPTPAQATPTPAPLSGIDALAALALKYNDQLHAVSIERDRFHIALCEVLAAGDTLSQAIARKALGTD